MSYVIPNFNLNVNIWTGPPIFPPVGAPRVATTCNLTPGRRVMQDSTGFNALMEILLPALTDIRGGNSATGSDVVEVPAASGRYYKVLSVDDIGKGFGNEHRIAWIAQSAGFITPIP
jgi:hypothetical protein